MADVAFQAMADQQIAARSTTPADWRLTVEATFSLQMQIPNAFGWGRLTGRSTLWPETAAASHQAMAARQKTPGSVALGRLPQMHRVICLSQIAYLMACLDTIRGFERLSPRRLLSRPRLRS